MKVSCLPVSLFSDICNKKMSLKEWAGFAKECDLDAIDISMIFLENHTPVYLDSVNKDMEQAGVAIKMATTYPDFTHPDEIQRERELDFLARDIAVCSKLNIQYLRVLAGQAHPETSREDGIKWAIEYLKRIAPIGEKYGVELLYEDHAKPGAWDYIDFSHPTDIFLEICEGIKDTSLGINFDTGNIVAYGDDPLEVLEKVIDKVVTIHVSDTSELGVFNPVAIGAGAVPNKELFKMLKQHGFDGWLCIEEASGNGIKGIKQAVSFVRKAWDSV